MLFFLSVSGFIVLAACVILDETWGSNLIFFLSRITSQSSGTSHDIFISCLFDELACFIVNYPFSSKNNVFFCYACFEDATIASCINSWNSTVMKIIKCNANWHRICRTDSGLLPVER